MLTNLCAALLLYGGLGAQAVTPEGFGVGNHYGWELGEAALQCRAESGLITEIYHLSGVNDEEPDGGINTLFVGYSAKYKQNYAIIEGGFNLSSGTTNEYGRLMYKASIEHRFKNGMYLKATKLEDTKFVSIGFTAEF